MLNSIALSIPWDQRIENFKISLGIMGKGWLSIFIVLGIIAIIVYLMTGAQNYINKKKEDHDTKDNQ